MGCKAIASKDISLMTKQFGPQTRCAHCCLEWTKGNYDTKILPLKLNKSMRKRLHRAKTKGKKDVEKKIYDKMHSNSLERLCHFCNKTTVISCLKPAAIRKLSLPTPERTAEKVSIQNSNLTKKKLPAIQKKTNSILPETNVYCNSKSAFTMDFAKSKNEEKQPKKIKNNKNKKDKFAGLCREAVLATAKEKNKDTNNSRLNLFLKPSL